MFNEVKRENYTDKFISFYRFRGLGVGKILFAHTENVARQMGARVLRGDCTSAYSRKIHDYFGWKTALEVFYKDYVDEKGKVLIKTLPPHDRYILKYKVLE